MAYLENLELRFEQIKKRDSVRHDSIARERENQTVEIIERLEEFAKMNAASFQSVEGSYSDDMLWLDQNSGFISTDKQDEIDSLKQKIENIDRSE